MENSFVCAHILCCSMSVLGCFSLLCIALSKALFVTGHALFFKDLSCKVDRETVCVGKLEAALTVKLRLAVFLHLCDKIVKYLHTSVDSGIEILLLSCEHLYDIVILFFKFVILTLVAVNNSFYKVFEEKSVYAEKLSVTNGSSEQTSHNVSSALV